MNFHFVSNFWLLLSQFANDFIQWLQRPIPVPTPSPIQIFMPSYSPGGNCTHSNIFQRSAIASSTGFIDGKKGFGMKLQTPQDLSKLLSLDVYWNYDWTMNRSTYQPSMPMFIPMASVGARSTLDFQQKILGNQDLLDAIGDGTIKYAMAFNEPDSANRFNMTVAAAIDRWPILEQLNVPLISPSCVRAYGAWMQEFMMMANRNCYRVDYVGVHWYGGPNFASFTSYMTNVYNIYKLPLVVTEFGVADWSASSIFTNRFTQAQVLSFMKQALPWLESTNWIAGYSWFCFGSTNQYGWISAPFDANGNLTNVGLYYKSVRTDNIMGNQSIL